MVGCRHRHTAFPKTCEGRMVVQRGAVFGVDIDEIESTRTTRELAFNVAQKAAQQDGFERMKEEGEDRAVG